MIELIPTFAIKNLNIRLLDNHSDLSSKLLITAIAVFVGAFLVAATITSQASAVKPPGTGPYCPAGTTYNDSTGRCEGPATCPSGFTPDTTGTCVAPTTSTCPPGFTPNTGGTCIAQPSLSNCPAGSTGINQQGQCTAPATEGSCPSTSFTFDSTTGQCVDGSACPAGTFAFKGGQCIDGNVCSYRVVHVIRFENGQCVDGSACPAGTTYDPTTNKCVSEPIPKPR